jgi:hypothetical protein
MSGLSWLSKLLGLGGNDQPHLGVPGSQVGGNGLQIPGAGSALGGPPGLGGASRSPLGLSGYQSYGGIGPLGGPMQPVGGMPGMTPPPSGSTDQPEDWRTRLGSAASGVGGFLKDNAGTLAGAGSALLSTRERGQELEFEKQKYADEQERKRRIADALAPLYQQTQANQRAAAPNPYLR